MQWPGQGSDNVTQQILSNSLLRTNDSHNTHEILALIWYMHTDLKCHVQHHLEPQLLVVVEP